MKSHRLEHDEALDLVDWAHAHMDSHILVRVPNAAVAGSRWAKQAAEGASRGFPDYLLIPRIAGVLAWELKKPGGTLRPEQGPWLERFRAHGHEAGWGTAAECIKVLRSVGQCRRS